MTEPRFWSPEDLATVEACWARGESASEIASRLPGRSRNSIISIVNRYRYKRGGASDLKTLPPAPRRAKMAVHMRRSALSAYLATSAAPITLAGPAWSHPARAG